MQTHTITRWHAQAATPQSAAAGAHRWPQTHTHAAASPHTCVCERAAPAAVRALQRQQARHLLLEDRGVRLHVRVAGRRELHGLHQRGRRPAVAARPEDAARGALWGVAVEQPVLCGPEAKAAGVRRQRRVHEVGVHLVKVRLVAGGGAQPRPHGHGHEQRIHPAPALRGARVCHLAVQVCCGRRQPRAVLGVAVAGEVQLQVGGRAHLVVRVSGAAAQLQAHVPAPLLAVRNHRVTQGGVPCGALQRGQTCVGGRCRASHIASSRLARVGRNRCCPLLRAVLPPPCLAPHRS
jgi:hypothetical protein